MASSPPVVTIIGSSIVRDIPAVAGVKKIGIGGLTSDRLLHYLHTKKVRIETQLVILYIGGNDMEQYGLRKARSLSAVLRTIAEIHVTIRRLYPFVKEVYQSELAPRERIPWYTFNQRIVETYGCVFRIAMYMSRGRKVRNSILQKGGVHLAPYGYAKFVVSLKRFVDRVHGPL